MHAGGEEEGHLWTFHDILTCKPASQGSITAHAPSSRAERALEASWAVRGLRDYFGGAFRWMAWPFACAASVLLALPAYTAQAPSVSSLRR
jgi:hypothetical protein